MKSFRVFGVFRGFIEMAGIRPGPVVRLGNITFFEDMEENFFAVS